MTQYQFTDQQLTKLKTEYEIMRNKTITPANARKLDKTIDKIPASGLQQLADADIPFISDVAELKYLNTLNK